ncbi:hypothetical protein L9F63_009787, partial [Diploptera punctata]
TEKTKTYDASWTLTGNNLERNVSGITDFNGVYKILDFQDDYYVDESNDDTDRIFFHYRLNMANKDGWDEELRDILKDLDVNTDEVLNDYTFNYF